MSLETIELGTPTATGGSLIGVENLTTTTATNAFIQVVKLGYGTDGGFIRVDTGAGLPVALGTTATVPVSVGAWTATGQVLTAPLSSATQPVDVTTWSATAIVPVEQASSATSPVSIASAVPLGVSATIPVSVGAYTATGQVLTSPLSSATQPVSVGTWTATGQVLTSPLSSATQPVSVGTWTATGEVLVNATATLPVSIASAVPLGTSATLPVSVGTWTATGQVLTSALSSATQPVSVGTWTATGQVLTSPLATATQPVSVATWTATGDVVAVQPSATELNAIIRPFALRGQGTQVFTSVSATARATIATGGGSNVFRDLVWMTLSNNATTEAQLQIRDTGTATWNNMNLAPDGGGMVFAPVVPAEQSAANASWDVQLESAVDGQVYIAAHFLDVT